MSKEKAKPAWKNIQPLIRERRESRGAEHASRDSRRTTKPIVLRGVETIGYRMIPAEEVALLRIDESYQRTEVRGLVNQLGYVLRNGGTIPHPVSLVERKKGGPLYVVDGQQRFWAHLDTDSDLPAMVYRVPEYADEREMFIVLNTTVRVTALAIVRGWPGPCRVLLEAAEDLDHGAHGRLCLDGKEGHRDLNGVSAIRAMYAAAVGRPARGQVVAFLGRLDAALTRGAARARAELILHILGDFFPAGLCGGVKPSAVGLVAYKRWAAAPVEPRQSVVTSIARIRWEDVLQTNAMKYLPMALDVVEKRWPS